MWRASQKIPLQIVVIAALPVMVLAADPPATKPPGTSYSSAPVANAWHASAGARERDASGFAGNAELTIRVYEGFGTFGPVYGQGYPAYGTDVKVRMEACDDGNTRISGLNIGGWEYQLGGSCERHHDQDSGAVYRDSAGRPDTPTETETASSATNSNVIRCDPASWNCRTLPR